VGGVAINLRAVGKQNRKGVRENVGSRLFDVIDPIVVRVVDTGQGEALATPQEASHSLSNMRLPIPSGLGTIRIVS